MYMESQLTLKKVGMVAGVVLVGFLAIIGLFTCVTVIVGHNMSKWESLHSDVYTYYYGGDQTLIKKESSYVTAYFSSKDPSMKQIQLSVQSCQETPEGPVKYYLVCSYVFPHPMALESIPSMDALAIHINRDEIRLLPPNRTIITTNRSNEVTHCKMLIETSAYMLNNWLPDTITAISFGELVDGMKKYPCKPDVVKQLRDNFSYMQ